MESFSEETQPLLKQIHQRHFVFKVLQAFLAITVAILLVLIIQQSVSISTVDTKEDTVDQILEGQAPPRLYNSRKKFTGSYSENEGENPVVTISNGNVRGVTLTSRLGRIYSAFYSMPYAESPTGAYRFQPPRPYKAQWENTFDGTVRGNAETECLQFKGSEIAGVEDCLKISVFSPKLPSADNPNPNLPVMFYILGGAYVFGRSNRYGAEYMMDEDVVLVHVDFRLGPFGNISVACLLEGRSTGHFSTEDEEIRGNMAFKDQVMALKWVQDNIAKFGGDPKRVVIFGNSSGAASVHAHIISKMSEGLFHRAISQSGSALLDPGPATRPLENAKNLGKLLNCTNVDDTALLHQCLINADPKMVASLHATLPRSYVILKEAIPKNGDRSEVFLEEMAGILLKNGDFNKNIPWLVGANSAEAYSSALHLLTNEKNVKLLNGFWDHAAPHQFTFEDDKNHGASAALKDFYFHGEEVSNKTRYELTDCMSDIKWVNPIVQAVNLHAKFGGKAFQFWITHEPLQSYGESSKRGFAAPYGVAHADEVQFFFPFEPFPYIGKESPDFDFSTAIVKIWANFARTGIPEVPSGETWLPIDGKNPRESSWMELNSRRFQLTNPLKKRLEFLDSFPLMDPNYEYREDSE